MTRLSWIAIALAVQLAGSRPALGQIPVVGLGARVRVTTSADLSLEQTLGLIDLSPLPGTTAITDTAVIVERPNLPALRVARPGTRVEGLLVEVTSRAIAVRADSSPDPMTIPRQAITSLERTSGHRSRLRKAAFGALIGFGAGAVAGLASTCDEGWFCEPGFRAFAGGIWGAGAGAVTGAVLPPAARWIAVPESSLVSSADPASVPRPPRPPARLEVIVGTGAAFRGPASDLEEAMRTAGYGDPLTGFGGPITHPVSYTGPGEAGTPYWLDARYTIRGPWNVSFQYSRVPIGQTSGYRAPGRFLFINYEAWTIAGTVSWRRGPLTLGGGPAVLTGRSRTLQPDDPGWVSHSKAGVIAEALLHIPQRTPVFLDVRTQYRYAGRVSVGPYAPFGWPAGSPPPFPAVDVRFNHWFVALGPGIRF